MNHTSGDGINYFIYSDAISTVECVAIRCGVRRVIHFEPLQIYVGENGTFHHCNIYHSRIHYVIGAESMKQYAWKNY